MENSNETTIRKETGLLYEDGSPVLSGDEVLGLDERWHVVTAVELDATGWRVWGERTEDEIGRYIVDEGLHGTPVCRDWREL